MGLRIRCCSVHSLVQTVDHWRMAGGAALGSARTNHSSSESMLASGSLHSKALWTSRLEVLSPSPTRSYKAGMGGRLSAAKVRVWFFLPSIFVFLFKTR